jgi:hypothetical protein
MPSATRQKLVDAAARRFYRDGFRNVGIDQILADSVLAKPRSTSISSARKT